VQEAAAVVPEPARATAVPTAPAATGGDTPAQLTPEQIKAAAIRSQRDFTLFGEIASVFMRSPEHKQMTLTELERLVVPAIATRQFLVAMAQSKSTGKRYPVAVLLWASVSPEIDRRLAVGGDKQYPLEAKDWKSGDIPWLLGAAGNPQLFGGMLKQLQSGALKGRSIKFQTPGDNGGAQVTALAAE
jgi:hemolysin-activating ACP:hemolysin acyltransferase